MGGLTDWEVRTWKGFEDGSKQRVCSEGVVVSPDARGQGMQGTAHIQEPVLGSWMVSSDR